jgi:uncharacterized protein with FMN-binding domain
MSSTTIATIRGAVGSALTIGALILVLSFRTPAPNGVVVGNNGGNGGNAGNGAGGNAGNQVQASPVSGSRATFTGQLTGSTIQTPFGNVQVQVTLQNGKITDVQALQMPSDQRRDVQIAQYAAPVLRSEALAANSAQIDTISGATYTSEGYIQSLQSALDQVGG